MKTLSGALSSALGAPVQQPAVLIEAGFSVTQRWSSYAQVDWSGFTWMQQAIQLERLQVDALRVTGSIVINNLDDSIGALVLAQRVTDKIIRIWGYDAAATAIGDVVWLCDAVGAAAEVTAEEVRIDLRHPSEFVTGPRTYIGPGAGFGSMLPPGAVMRINGIDYRLERRS